MSQTERQKHPKPTEQESSSGIQTSVEEDEMVHNEDNKLERAHSNDVSSQEEELPPLPQKTFNEYIFISLLCFLIAFGGFVFGFDTGTISGFVNMSDFLQRFGEVDASGDHYLSNVRTGLIVSIFNIGCAIGGIFLSKVADVYGRRAGLMFSMFIYVVGIIVQISSSHDWYQIVIGRAISGLAVGMVAVLSPLFIGETAPKALRGTLVTCFQLCVTLGIFLGYCTTYGTKTYSDSRQWRVPLGLCFLWAIFLVSGMLCMPESPRYLVEMGRIDDARRSVARSNKVPVEEPGVNTEIQLIQAGIEREKLAGSASWTQLVTGKPRIFERVIMGIVLQSLQQLTGDNYFFYYGTTIFQAVGLDDSFETSIILGVVNFASTFFGIYVIDRFGRRKCLLTGSVLMFICFIIYSVLGSTHLYIDGYDGSTRQSTGDAMIFITCLYIFCFASTWAGGIYCIVSETYPLRIRSKAMSVATAANWLWGFLISFFTPFITSAIHFYYGFVFSGCLLFSIFYVYFFVNETKGLSLEEVDELYAQRILPWKSASWVPPTRQEMAHSAGFAQSAKPEQEHV